MTEDNTHKIFGLSLAHLVTDFYSPVLPAILPMLIAQNGYPFFLAGLIVTAFNLMSSFSQPIVGWIYDRKGLALHVSIPVLFCAFFISSIGLLHEYWLIVAFACMAALGPALFHPGAMGMVSRLAEGSRRGRLTSYFVVGGNLGFAIGPVVAGAVVALLGLQGLVLLVIPGILMSLILRRIIPDMKLPEMKEAPRSAENTTSHPAYAVGLVVTGSALRAWAIFASVAFLPTFLTHSGFDLVTANLLVSGMLVAGVIGQVIGGSLSDRYGRKEYTLFGLLASILPLYIFLNSDGLISIVALLLFGFFLWSTFAVTVAMAHELMPRDAGTVSGLMLGLAVGAGGMGVALTGYVADLYGLVFAISTLAVPIVAALFIFMLVPYPWHFFRHARQMYLK